MIRLSEASIPNLKFEDNNSQIIKAIHKLNHILMLK